MSFSDTAPKLLDSDNNLLFKIAQILNAGGGSGGGGGGGTLSTDGTFAANSDLLYPSQKAAKTYIDTKTGLYVLKSGDAGLGSMVWGGGEASINSDGSATFSSGTVFFDIDGSGFFAGGNVQFSSLGVLTAMGFAGPLTGAASLNVLKAGDTMTGKLLITPAVNTNALAVTGYSLTGSDASSLMDLAGTWNTSGVATALKLNILNTASGTGSLLMDLQVGSASMFQVTKTGAIIFGTAGTAALPSLSNSATVNGLTTGFFWPSTGNGTVSFTSQSVEKVKFGAAAVQLADTYSLAWGTIGGTGDLFLYRDGAANTLALRNSTAAQTFRLYNTYTDASNYERGVIRYVAGILQIGTESAGTGTPNVMAVGTFGASLLKLFTSGINRWHVSTAGHFFAESDNSYDIGASGATRPRSIYAGTAFITGDYFASSDATAALRGGAGVLLANTARVSWSSTSNWTSTLDLVLSRDAAGVLALRNTTNAQTFRVYGTYTDASNFNRIEFLHGGSTNGGTIQVSALGTGEVGPLTFAVSKTAAAPTNIFNISTGGHILFNTDGVSDIGASGATRPRNVFAGSAIVAGTTLQIVSSFSLSGPSSGVITLNNWGGGDFNRIQFGGTTSSFPSLKRSLTTLQVRLADDSAYAGFAALDGFFTGALTCVGLASSSHVSAGATSSLYFFGRTTLWSPADSVLLLQNSAANDFGRLQFGGTTSSFPSIKRNGAGLDFRLADDSAYATITSGNHTMATAALLSVTSGTDQRAGDAVLVGGTVTVANTTVTANTRVFAQRKAAGGTIGMSLTYTVSASTSFTITSDNILDTSTYSYILIEVP